MALGSLGGRVLTARKPAQAPISDHPLDSTLTTRIITAKPRSLPKNDGDDFYNLGLSHSLRLSGLLRFFVKI